MAHNKDYFPILKKIVRPEEIFFDYSDVKLFNEFHKTAQKEGYLYVWFDKHTQTLKATFKQPNCFLSLIEESGWQTGHELVAFGVTPHVMDLSKPMMVTIFTQEMVVDSSLRWLCKDFIKKLQKADLLVSVNV